jgi:hypothetical protein
MTNPSFLTHLQAGIRTLLDIAADDIRRSSETETRFSLCMGIDSDAMCQIFTALAAYSELFDVSFEYRIQQGSGTAVLRDNRLIIIDWQEDADLTPPELEPQVAEQYTALVEQLAQLERPIRSGALAKKLRRLAMAGAEVDLFLSVFLNKEALTRKLGLPEHVRCLVYISADKFLKEIENKPFQASWDLLIPGNEDTMLFLFGDVLGSASGPNVRICGRDVWAKPENYSFQASLPARDKVNRAINFRKAEAAWEVEQPGLTPFHLFVETPGLSRPDILNSLARLRNNLAVVYLADRTQATNGSLRCQFSGQKRVWLTLPSPNGSTATTSIFNLFNWAYDNSSSDKLNIVRQIIALQLGDDSRSNGALLFEKAADMLGAAKSNFRIFLRRNVELYFDRRLKIGEFIQEFSEEVGASVSSLTSELIGNLYRTVGIVLGVVIAILLKPDNMPVVVYWTSFLYLLYIIFILAYMLPATYLRFRNKVYEYHHGMTELRDVLSREELLRLQGNAFRRSRSLFLLYFALTNLLYALLGLAAFTLMQSL